MGLEALWRSNQPSEPEIEAAILEFCELPPGLMDAELTTLKRDLCSRQMTLLEGQLMLTVLTLFSLLLAMPPEMRMVIAKTHSEGG